MALLDLAARLGMDPAHTPIVLTYPHPHSDFAIFTGITWITQDGTARTSDSPILSPSSNYNKLPLGGSIPRRKKWMSGRSPSPSMRYFAANSGRKAAASSRQGIRAHRELITLLATLRITCESGLPRASLQKLQGTLPVSGKPAHQQAHLRMGELQEFLLPARLEHACVDRSGQHQLCGRKGRNPVNPEALAGI